MFCLFRFSGESSWFVFYSKMDFDFQLYFLVSFVSTWGWIYMFLWSWGKCKKLFMLQKSDCVLSNQSSFFSSLIKERLDHFFLWMGTTLFLSFSVHFWAPTFKWGISIANIADFAKPPEKLSYPQQIGMCIFLMFLAISYSSCA